MRLVDDLSVADRKALTDTIVDSIAKMHGVIDERRYLLDILGVVSAKIHEAKLASTVLAMQMQINLLQLEVAGLQRAAQ